jgi:hypothetical protein
MGKPEICGGPFEPTDCLLGLDTEDEAEERETCPFAMFMIFVGIEFGTV